MACYINLRMIPKIFKKRQKNLYFFYYFQGISFHFDQTKGKTLHAAFNKESYNMQNRYQQV